jgi:DNA replication protein DnaC
MCQAAYRAPDDPVAAAWTAAARRARICGRVVKTRPHRRWLVEARGEKRQLRYHKHLARQELLIVDDPGFVPLAKTGAEMLFEVFSQRYERTSTLATSNLPFAEWTGLLGSERLTGALLDRLTYHIHILEMNGESFRLKNGRKKKDPGPQ